MVKNVVRSSADVRPVPVARIVNAATNYWKHAPEAGLLASPGDILRQATLDALTAVGVTGSDYIVSQALDALVGPPSPARLAVLVSMLVHWRDAAPFDRSVFTAPLK